MKGDAGTTRDLIRKTKMGILVRRLWYIRFVDQKTLVLTGMTRDGVFMIRDGIPEEPLHDFRWNWRPLELFGRIEALGAPERKSYAFVPPVVVGGVKFPCV
jgi:predicted Zn-dependent protease